jgi:hypothetical protein
LLVLLQKHYVPQTPIYYITVNATDSQTLLTANNKLQQIMPVPALNLLCQSLNMFDDFAKV